MYSVRLTIEPNRTRFVVVAPNGQPVATLADRSKAKHVAATLTRRDLYAALYRNYVDRTRKGGGR